MQGLAVKICLLCFRNVLFYSKVSKVHHCVAQVPTQKQLAWFFLLFGSFVSLQFSFSSFPSCWNNARCIVGQTGQRERHSHTRLLFLDQGRIWNEEVKPPPTWPVALCPFYLCVCVLCRKRPILLPLPPPLLFISNSSFIPIYNAYTLGFHRDCPPSSSLQLLLLLLYSKNDHRTSSWPLARKHAAGEAALLLLLLLMCWWRHLERRRSYFVELCLRQSIWRCSLHSAF